MKKSKSVQVLEMARTAIEQGWTTGHAARDAFGRACSPHQAVAKSYCALGAIEKASNMNLNYWDDYPREAKGACRLLIKSSEEGEHSPLPNAITCYNDRFIENQEQALAWFDRAIDRGNKRRFLQWL